MFVPNNFIETFIVLFKLNKTNITVYYILIITLNKIYKSLTKQNFYLQSKIKSLGHCWLDYIPWFLLLYSLGGVLSAFRRDFPLSYLLSLLPGSWIGGSSLTIVSFTLHPFR